MQPNQTGKKGFESLTKNLFLINGLTALAYAFILPVMSTFLVDHLNAPPVYIAIYSVGFAVSGLIFSQWFGQLADKGRSKKQLFLLSLSSIFLSAVAFYNTSQIWQALLIGLVLMGAGHASIPQLLAMIRVHAVASGKDSARLNSQMRSAVSIVWIVGPPSAFILIDKFGFKFNFVLSAIITLFVFAFSLARLPAFKVLPPVASSLQEKPLITGRVCLLGAAIFFSNAANSMYITAMPLYLIREMETPVYLPGLLLGITSVFEIPVMLVSAALCRKYGKYNLMLFGYACAIIFYALFQIVAETYMFLLVQLFNGLFFGIFIGLAITIVQDAMPDRVGFASAFYSNVMRLGMMAGVSLVGLVAQLSSFKLALFGCLVCAVLAALLMLAAWRLESIQVASA
ncbi:MFS transporter [Pseudomonas savastanoi pv. retacarpa]|uniref:sugar efflux transporter n=1 Tax=Pseudomonas savastanoi TaxID=29438 RepID=UPI0006E5ADCA|nr:sugar efflux transporter [Pseudomonas savastanoi]KPY32494.1 Major facilitator family protein [Pseudomonas savastanoi pv. retacarpa]OSR28571.1 MFS transporter [Pseudomonas savastanoi pv. retacarpa]RML15932.1 Major facilitator protein [Pseudomonas savastanoi pv. retacarpa]RMP55072.1 Major facilitator protein [Pseudomonas savastanoi pv. retacarpa]